MSNEMPNVPPEGPAQPSGGQTKDERTMAMLAHILGIFFSFIGPLVIWLMKKEESAFVDDQGKEALNFQITLLIGYVAIGVLNMTPIGCLANIAYPALWIVDAVLSIMGGMKANEGVLYRYPVSLRLIK